VLARSQVAAVGDTRMQEADGLVGETAVCPV
jgi:hypothetical protein